MTSSAASPSQVSMHLTTGRANARLCPTGTECVKQLLAKGIACTATSRSGSFKSEFEDPSALLTAAAVDVTNLSSVSAAVKGAKGVIFAASASKGGGNAEAVDYKGVVNAAKACLENNVPRCVCGPDAVGVLAMLLMQESPMMHEGRSVKCAILS
eukprot:TRINITY_DN2822_c0_g1_i1.p2 TRINITY_DN2822_c0_g1~~TRINITY_DN2822_c0_g1_i1.p2  ORF type:complete len:155 (-),score=30.49 TRINITY_DN2822_c0_g1_i1:1658-2122(-)